MIIYLFSLPFNFCHIFISLIFILDDPLEPNRRAIKAVTFNLNDPTKIGLQKADEEGSMLGGKKINQKLGKETLNVEQWATGKIEATPYGVGEKMMIGGNKNPLGAGPRGNTRGELKSGGRSNIAFDHFTFPTDHDSLDQEMPRGKRTIPTSVTNPTADRLFGSAY